MGTGRKVVAALLALALSLAVQAREQPHIQFAEKVALTAGTAQMQFDAYGRRFVLNLQSNDRVSIAGYRLWRGTLEGAPGSWVRLTEHAGASEGVIWDGRDLYAVTRYETIVTYLGSKLSAKPADTVIFRLSDSANLLPSGYCATGPSSDGLASNNSLVQYRNMVAELQAQIPAGASKKIEIALIADSAMQTRMNDPVGAMLTSYNIVDGIYAEQLGLLIVPAEVRSIPAAGDPFTATDPSALLGQLTTYRKNTPAVASLGIAHLFTGLLLDGDTVGIARLNSACSADAASLTEGWHGFWTSALVMAHEIGHNLNAEHDGAGACAATPPDYLMSPSLNGSEQFSQCSLTAINAFIATAPPSCVTPAIYAHVELPRTSARVTGELDVPLVVPIELYSTGTRAVNGVRLDLTVHPSLVLTATSAGVNCAPVGLGLVCDVGSIAAGATRVVELTFLPTMQGGLPAEVSVFASNNQNTRHATHSVLIDILPNVDTAVSVATSRPSAIFGDDVDVTLTVKSLKSHTARNVRVGVYGGGLRGFSVDAPPGVTCQFDVNAPGQTFCNLGDVPGNTTRTIVVHSKAFQVGSRLQGTAYSSADNDSNYSNDTVHFTMDNILAAHDVGLEDLTTSAPVQLNMPFEYKGNLRSYGTQSVSGVRVSVNLYMQTNTALNAVSSVTVGGNACTKVEIYQYECNVGTMAAGEVLPISIKGISTALGEVRVTLNSYASINDDPGNDQVYRGWVVRYGLDASVTGTSQLFLFEGKEESSSFAAWSNGTQASTNAVMNVELPPQVRFTRFFVREPTTTSCSIVDPQHLRCVYNIPPLSSYQDVSYFVVSDVAGAYQASATITLAGDENPANDRVQWPITVTTPADVGVRSSVVFPKYLVTGHDLAVPFTVFTGPRAVNGVSVNVTAHASAEIASLSAGAGNCTRVDAHSYTCALGNLAGDSTVNFTATVAASGMGLGVFGASVNATADDIPNNNAVSAVFNTASAGDARVTVAGTSFTATAGTVFALPSITVWRQGEIVDGKLRITLPAGVSISSMSGSVYTCAGTTTLECELPASWPENQGIQVDLNLLASAASNFVIKAKIVAANDFASSNDEATIAVTVNPAQTPPSNPPSSGGGSQGGGGGGGGGGRLEWPVALVLGWLLIRRQRRTLVRH